MRLEDDKKSFWGSWWFITIKFISVLAVCVLWANAEEDNKRLRQEISDLKWSLVVIETALDNGYAEFPKKGKIFVAERIEQNDKCMTCHGEASSARAPVDMICPSWEEPRKKLNPEK